VLKVDEKQCELDMLHDEQVRLGENKYSTLKKVNILNFNISFKSKFNYSGSYSQFFWYYKNVCKN